MTQPEPPTEDSRWYYGGWDNLIWRARQAAQEKHERLVAKYKSREGTSEGRSR